MACRALPQSHLDQLYKYFTPSFYIIMRTPYYQTRMIDMSNDRLTMPAVAATLEKQRKGTSPTLHSADDAALHAIRAAFSHPPSKWSESKPTDTWEGLTFKVIAGKKRVVALEWLKATGRLAPEIADLKHLRKLSVYGAGIEGPLPESIGKLKNLRELSLIRLPRLGDTLPESISELESLEELRLERLPITTLPDGLGELKNLKSLYVTRCPITEIPASLERAKKLDDLWLDGCPVNTLPDLPRLWPKLWRLHVCGAKLTAIPAFVSRLKKLAILSLSNNKISGPIPDYIFTSKLDSLYLSDNAFSGQIPDAICKSPLKYLELNNNQLSGIVPDCLASMDLQTVDYSGNKQLTMSKAVADQANEAKFYTKHYFLQYRKTPMNDDSYLRGPKLKLYGVTEPFKLRNKSDDHEWRSLKRRSNFWGEDQEFYCRLFLLKAMNTEELEKILPVFTPQMNEAMKKAEAVPMEEIHAAVTEYIYDNILKKLGEEAVSEDPCEDWLPPRERFGEVLWGTEVMAKFRLREDGTLSHEIRISFSTYEYYTGLFCIYAYIEDGKLIKVGDTEDDLDVMF